MAKIFVIEDNESLREAITAYLRLHDHEVVEFGKIGGVEEALDAHEPSLIVLDVMLPDGDGFGLAKKIRRKHQIPILFLTARVSESDRITGFEVGGDDYVTKPFSTKELVLRIEAILRRSGADAVHGSETDTWILGEHDLRLDRPSHRAFASGQEIHLTAAEWRILEFLADRPGMPISRSRLMADSLDYMHPDGSERTIDTHVKNLRSKMTGREWIETVRGFGYRFSGKPK